MATYPKTKKKMIILGVITLAWAIASVYIFNQYSQFDMYNYLADAFMAMFVCACFIYLSAEYTAYVYDQLEEDRL